MEELYGKLFSTMHQFQRLRIGDLFPDMTNGECMTLLAIDRFNQEKENGVLTVSELADHIHSKTSAVSRTLKLLEDRELIVRTVNRSDRRNTYVELTKLGIEEKQKIETMMMDFAQAVMNRMNEEDMIKLIAYLDQLYQASKNEIEVRKKKLERKD